MINFDKPKYEPLKHADDTPELHCKIRTTELHWGNTHDKHWKTDHWWPL